MDTEPILNKWTALVEAIRFLESEPQSQQNLARISDLSEDVVQIALERLREKYVAEDSGIELVQISGGWSLTPKKDLWSFLKERYGKKSEGKLSRAAMETLAIIAYSQRITRAEIAAHRGVSADNMIGIVVKGDRKEGWAGKASAVRYHQGLPPAVQAQQHR